MKMKIMIMAAAVLCIAGCGTAKNTSPRYDVPEERQGKDTSTPEKTPPAAAPVQKLPEGINEIDADVLARCQYAEDFDLQRYR